VAANTAKSEGLARSRAGGLEGIGSIDSVVCSQSLDDDTMLMAEGFEISF
jgi:hypothetical protein